MLGDSLLSTPLYYTFKIIMAGDAAVGKTSLVRRYIHHTFKENYLITIGVQVSTTEIKIENATIKLIVWDVAGQKSFQTVLPLYFKGADASILVFDVTNRNTFNNVENWLKRIRETEPESVVILCGNKTDMSYARVVKREEAEKKAQELGVLDYIETSAKTGYGVQELFLIAVKRCLEKKLKALKKAT